MGVLALSAMTAQAAKLYKAITIPKDGIPVGDHKVKITTPNKSDLNGMYFPKIIVSNGKKDGHAVTTGEGTWPTLLQKRIKLPNGPTEKDVLTALSDLGIPNSSIRSFGKNGNSQFVAISHEEQGNKKVPNVHLIQGEGISDWIQGEGISDWGLYTLPANDILAGLQNPDLTPAPTHRMSQYTKKIRQAVKIYPDQIKVTKVTKNGKQQSVPVYRLLKDEQGPDLDLIKHQWLMGNIYGSNPDPVQLERAKKNLIDSANPDPLQDIVGLPHEQAQREKDNMMYPQNFSSVQPLVFHQTKGVKLVPAMFDGLADVVDGASFSTVLPTAVVAATLHPNLFPVFGVSRYPLRTQEKLVRSGMEVELLGDIAMGDTLRARSRITKLKRTSKGHYFMEVTADVLNQRNEVVANIKNGLMVLVGNEIPQANPVEGPIPPDDSYDFHRTYVIPSEIGKRYGKVSHDRNDVHTDPDLAKLFANSSSPIQQGSLTSFRANQAADEALRKKKLDPTLKKTSGMYLDKILEGDKIDEYVSTAQRKVLQYRGPVLVYQGTF